VTFAPNNSHAARNSTAAFVKPGKYKLSVTATDVSGLSATRTLSVQVIATAQPQILLTPESVMAPAKGKQKFTATITDQFGKKKSAKLVWSVDGGGTITSGGVFRAGDAAGGPFTVTVARKDDPSVKPTATVVVTPAQ
jgi:hypothetical protein